MDMKLSCLLLLSLAHIVLARKVRSRSAAEREGPESSSSSWGRRGPKRRLCPSLPECEEYHKMLAQELDCLKEKGLASPYDCDGNDPAECKFNDWSKAAENIDDVPSPECWEQIEIIYKTSERINRRDGSKRRNI